MGDMKPDSIAAQAEMRLSSERFLSQTKINIEVSTAIGKANTQNQRTMLISPLLLKISHATA
jgi:hypothetical protein